MADLRLRNPFSMIVAGSSQTGKTHWVLELLCRKHPLYTEAPGRVFFFYNEWQKSYDTVPDVEFVQGMPSMAFLKENAGENSTVVIDDLVHHIDENTAEMFTVGCSRYGVNLIFITQNLFEKNKFFRTISLNCKYICIRKNPRDSSSIVHFAKQFAPLNTRFVAGAYSEATSKTPYSYLFFDLCQETPEQMRVRTNLFSERGTPQICFVPNPM